MRRFLSFTFVAACLVLVTGLSKAGAQETKYWDINGALPGATDAFGFADGTWDTTSTNWNLNPDGTDPTTTWNPGDDAVFSAGDDVLNDPVNSGAFVTVSGTQEANSVLIQNGYVAWRDGTVNSPLITIEAGTTLDIDSTLRLQNAPGKVLLRGGELLQTNPGQAGTFIWTAIEIEIEDTGIVSYTSSGVGTVSIYQGTILGTGGTTTDPAGTLIKRGEHEFRVQGPGHENNTFAKLIVEEGLYRMGHATAGNFSTAFGAVLPVETPDAITLDGGGIGVSVAPVDGILHPNRGIMVTENGGFYNGGGFGVLTVQGPFSGTGTFTMHTGGGGMRLQNANNTFSGDLVIDATTLFADAPVSPASLSGTGGTVTVAEGSTLTVGSGNATTTYEGNVSGAGGFTKVGTGTQTLANNNYAGDTRVEGGTLSLANATLGDNSDVYLFTGGVLDLNFVATDTIRSLFIDDAIQSVGTWGAPGSGADFTTDLLSGTGLLNVTLDMPPVGVPGDFNDDGIVNAADYTVWRDNLGEPGLPNDEGLGTVGPSHYDLWVANFGSSSPGAGAALGAAAVPEPTTLVLTLVSLAGLALVRRRR